MINKIRTTLKGFTLIETLVAVMILITAIAGPLSIASRGLTSALIAKDQVTAYYLAQDAMEFVRYARDTNKLLGSTDWIVGTGALDSTKSFDLTKCTVATSPNGCSLDSTANFSATNPNTCSLPACTQGNLRYDTGTRLYKTSGSLTGLVFNRVIKISIPNPPNDGTKERKVTVTVSWSDQAGITRSVVISENILNWQ